MGQFFVIKIMERQFEMPGDKIENSEVEFNSCLKKQNQKCPNVLQILKQ